MNITPIITAGDATSWIDDPFTAPDGSVITSLAYSLGYAFRGPGATLDLTGTAKGSGWQFSLTNAQTATFNNSGARVQWFFQAFATANVGGARYTAGNGALVVLPNLAGLTGTYDGRTQVERDLAAVTAEISARITGGLTLEYTIGNRNLKKEATAALLEMQSRLRVQLARQKTAQSIANGLGDPTKKFVRFAPK